MKIHESGENYLETILQLEMKNGSVRSIDIATHLEYSKPSISRAMAILKKERYITIEDGGLIHLTALGREIANKIYERHQLLAKHLMQLGVSENVALQDACRIEHVISEESFERIKEYHQASYKRLL